MSNEQNSAPIDARSKEQQIEDMLITAASARGEMPTPRNIGGHPSMSVKLIPGQEPVVEYHSTEDARLAEMQASMPAQDIRDDGRDLQAELKQLADEFNRLEAEKNAVVYDPQTGAKSWKHSAADRERFAILAKQAWSNLDYQAQINARIQAQRERKAAEREAQARAEVEREEWLTREAIKRADEMEIERRAAAIIQQRRNRIA